MKKHTVHDTSNSRKRAIPQDRGSNFLIKECNRLNSRSLWCINMSYHPFEIHGQQMFPGEHRKAQLVTLVDTPI